MRRIDKTARAKRLAIRDGIRARHPYLFPAARDPADHTTIVLGRDQAGSPVILPERPRLEHAHVIGTTGGGKSKFIEHCVRQDIANGRGVCVIDPHGEHPDSLYRSILAWLVSSGFNDRRTIHLIDPNAPNHTVGFNPLARPDPDTDLSVIAGVTLEAFSRAWGGEDTSTKPTIERVLTATFTALAELGYTLVEAPLLLDRADRCGLRALALRKVTDRYTREELRRLHELSLNERRSHDFDLEVVGPINRIARFVRPPAIRAMVGQTDRVLDIREALDEGHVILVNLSGGARVYERDADLLGRLLTRFLFFHAKRRRAPERPFFVYLDECHRYLSGDLENILAEARKYGIAAILAHQWLAQLAVEGDNMLAAVLNATNLKVVFRLKDPKEAEALAHAVIPLDLEMPVASLAKPTLVGHTRVTLSGESESEQQASTASSSESRGESGGYAESFAESTASTDGRSESDTQSSSRSTSDAVGQSSMSGTAGTETYTESLTPVIGLFDVPFVLGTTSGVASGSTAAEGVTTSSATGQAHGKARSVGTSRAQSRATAHGETYSHSETRSRSSGRAETVGSGRTKSTAEAFEPILANLPSAVHGKDNVLYMAAQTLRNLTTGKAFVNFVGRDGMRPVLLTVPKIGERRLTTDAFVALRNRLLSSSRSAMPISEAAALVEKREQDLIGSLAIPEPEPTTFRTRAPADETVRERTQPAATSRGKTRSNVKDRSSIR